VEGRYRDIDHEYDKAIEIYRSLFVLFPDNLDYGLRLAAVEVLGSKGQDALATVDSLRKLLPPASELPLIDLQEAEAWETLGDFKHEEQPLTRAVESARAQGSRLILAEAQGRRCWLFTYLAQPPNAVAACREARDIYAAAGDGHGEAGSLNNWANAISQTDALESIRLFQKEQTISHQVGSELDEAHALLNLGIAFEGQAISPPPKKCTARHCPSVAASTTKGPRLTRSEISPTSEWSRGIFRALRRDMKRRCNWQGQPRIPE